MRHSVPVCRDLQDHQENQGELSSGLKDHRERRENEESVVKLEIRDHRAFQVQQTF